MNRSLISGVIFAALVGSAVALAQDGKAPTGAPAMPSSSAAASGSPGGRMGTMDEHMKKMQALHERMMKASTPEERQKLMDESRQDMQECMGMMNPMQGGMMEGGMMAKVGKGTDTNAQMQMMHKRMDMMQMMMQMMIDQQGLMAGSKGARPAAPK